MEQGERITRLIRAIIIAMGIVSLLLIGIIIFIYRAQSNVIISYSFWGSIIMIPILGLGYVLNEKRKPNMAMHLLILTTTSIALLVGIIEDDNLLPYLIIPLLLSGIFLDYRTNVIWTILIFTSTFLGSFISKHYDMLGFFYGIGSFLLLTSSLLLVYKKHRNNLEKDRVEEIQKNKNHLLALLQNLQDGVISTDKQGLIEFMNPIAEKLTGYEEKKAKGLPLNSVYKTTTDKNFDEMLELIKRKDSISINKTAQMHYKGETLIIDETFALIKSPEGNLTGVIVTFRDITDAKKKEEELKERMEESKIFLKAAVGREEKMKELKNLIRKLESE